MRTFPRKLFFPLLAIAALTQACSQTSFSTGAPDGVSAQINGGNSCPPLMNQSVPVKIVLVVDASGSNADGSRSVGTDNYKNLRGGSIQNFFDKYKTQGNFSWSFLVFQESSAYSLIPQGFSSFPGDMQQAISDFYSIQDQGGTPYRAALSRARQVIQQDSSTANTKYMVVFISDGLPDPVVSNSTLQSDIQDLISVRPGQITLSSIYYGTFNQEASDRLAMMASFGSGGFLDANSSSGQTFSIESAIQGPGNCGP